MAYKFYVTRNDAQIGHGNITVSISFKLIDDTIVDPVAQIMDTTTVSINIPQNATTQQAKTQIANDVVAILQDFYNAWNKRTTKIVDLLTSNQTALETYVNNHITY